MIFQTTTMVRITFLLSNLPDISVSDGVPKVVNCVNWIDKNRNSNLKVKIGNNPDTKDWALMILLNHWSTNDKVGENLVKN